jgi:pimeloyl-ACP methyl ester carboxylesterase
MKTDSLEQVTINSSKQWILVRGKDSTAPLIIHVQAGPGLPIIPEANAMEKLLHLEEDFLVAYWDQRNCGKSYNKETDPASINFSQLRDDLISCTKYLLKKFDKAKAIIIGYSIGASIAIMAAEKEGSLYDSLFLVGMDIDVPYANEFAMEFAIAKAQEKNNAKLLQKARQLSGVVITNAKLFQQRARLITDLGGIKMGSSYNQLQFSTVTNMLFSKAYRLRDISKTIEGMEECQNRLLPELNELNLFKRVARVEVPVHFIQGKKDVVAPFVVALKYYEFLQAETKTFTCFDHSAHTPHYDEPNKFANLLRSKVKL